MIEMSIRAPLVMKVALNNNTHVVLKSLSFSVVCVKAHFEVCHFLIQHTDSEEEMIRSMTLGIITAVEDVTDPIPCDCNDVTLVIEEAVVLRGLGDIPNAYVNMMGLLYALNINYPKNLKYTFEVIQRLLMNIGAEYLQCKSALP